MNTHVAGSAQTSQFLSAEQFGRKVARRLDESVDALPYDISERLRAARMQALGQRRVVQIQASSNVSVSGGAAVLQRGKQGWGVWGKFAAYIPLLALVVGVVCIDMVQDDLRAREIAEVDSELLSDDLPPAAYIDPGFAQFLRSNLPGKDNAR